MDMTLWTLLALVLFIALLVVLKVPQWIVARLDGRSKRIADELYEAKRLREEAQAILEECKRKTSEVEQQTHEILEQAKHEAQALLEEAKVKIQDYVERRQKLAEEKIVRAESEALASVKARVVDVAASAAERILREQTSEEETDKEQFEASLKEVRARFN